MPAAKSKPVKAKKKQKGAARKRAAPASSLANALAEAAWLDADSALAEALAAYDETESALDAASRDAAWILLGQSLSRAGRKRGLTRIGALDAREPYKKSRHDLVIVTKTQPKNVHVLARGVARGTDLLVKTRVRPVRRKRK